MPSHSPLMVMWKFSAKIIRSIKKSKKSADYFIIQPIIKKRLPSFGGKPFLVRVFRAAWLLLLFVRDVGVRVMYQKKPLPIQGGAFLLIRQAQNYLLPLLREEGPGVVDNEAEKSTPPNLPFPRGGISLPSLINKYFSVWANQRFGHNELIR